MINEHVNKELSIVKILRLLISQVGHDPNLFEQLLSKMNDIISFNLKIVKRRYSQELKSVILLLTLILLNISKRIIEVTFH
jgi:hypothetical protein